MELHSRTAMACSKLITQAYSTSFSLGIRTLAPRFRLPIYSIYAYVRSADEIVDTFHNQDKALLLQEFAEQTKLALQRRLHLNPVLHAFQQVVHEYQIDVSLVDAFLHSMEMDLHQQAYDATAYKEYIYGSAEVVGLMCLQVFCEKDAALYARLQAPARSLGAAFQKVNFLRDVQADFLERGRIYFPGINFNCFDGEGKRCIEQDIEQDFAAAFQGILALPKAVRLGVYVAYIYYRKLFYKIRRLPAARILQERIRVPAHQKMALLLGALLRHQVNAI